MDWGFQSALTADRAVLTLANVANVTVDHEALEHRLVRVEFVTRCSRTRRWEAARDIPNGRITLWEKGSTWSTRKTAHNDGTGIGIRNPAPTTASCSCGIEFCSATPATGHASQATGNVLEVTVGTGLNLDAYSQEVRLTGTDRSEQMLAIARTRAVSSDARSTCGRGTRTRCHSPPPRSTLSFALSGCARYPTSVHRSMR